MNDFSAGRVVVTGAAGFVGRALVDDLSARQLDATAVSRNQMRWPAGIRSILITDVRGDTDWSAALEGVQVVIHCAARVHVMRDRSPDPLADFRRVNVDGSVRLAEEAARHGVRRFVFVSSVKVNGEATELGSPFTATMAAAPVDPYGVSKAEAERALQAVCAATGLELVIVRPPLVYGPGVRANFAALMSAVVRGIPIPLGALTNNRRSLVSIANLTDLLIHCASHPAAAGGTFFASDDHDVSTAQLVRQIAHALRAPDRILRVSPALLQFGATMLGRTDTWTRLSGSLQVDVESTKRRLAWKPPVTFEQGIQATADAFLEQRAARQ